MTVQEAKAKEVLNNIWDFADAQDEEKGDVVDDAIIEAIGCMEEVEQYRALGTVEELKEAREKQVASKPLYRQGTLFKWIDTVIERGRNVNVPKWSNRDACPNCKKDVLKTNYCPNCGQALDWSEEDD